LATTLRPGGGASQFETPDQNLFGGHGNVQGFSERQGA